MHKFVGALPKVPITNNALEAFNRALKDQYLWSVCYVQLCIIQPV